ncbi:UNVERIFIED_CONTAM: transmembrane protein, putative [Hammondia hammondi]|eukprot:XP_008881933.1 transmembrane protein, putative [Hammondia hammondi]
MMANVAAVLCVVVFWCILVPFGQFFRSASSILEHTVCLVSAFLITYTGRVPFLVYHFWVASLLSIAYCIVCVIVYTVPVTVGDKVGYVYSIFDFPAHPIKAWVSFVVVSTAGGAVAALIVWSLCWKTNALFDPARVKESVYPSETLSPPFTRYHRGRENISASCKVMYEERVDAHRESYPSERLGGEGEMAGSRQFALSRIWIAIRLKNEGRIPSP